MAQKKGEMKLDHVNKQIVLSCSFNKRQADPSSSEYTRLCEVLQMFPDYRIVKKTIRRKENKEAYRGLTYAYMEAYIDIRGDKKDMEEYRQMRLLAKCHSVRFPAIKQWFLRKYPEVVKYGAREEFIQPNAA